MNIIVGYNGSEVSMKAINMAKKHAKAFDAVVTIFVSMEREVNNEFSHKEADCYWNTIKEVKADLERIKEEFKKESIDCLTQLSVRGLDPGNDILDYAKQIMADEIIIGIEKKSKVGKLIFGSTAQTVILQSKCPVLAVGI